MPNGDQSLQNRLAKLQALFERAGSAGEREAASAAIERLREQQGGAAAPERDLSERDPGERDIGRRKDRARKASAEAHATHSAEEGADAHLTELKISLPDDWSVRLFVALCRKHGLRPYRYPRQRRTTVQLRVDERFFRAVVWPEFSDLQAALEGYFQETVDHLIAHAMGSDGDDSALWRKTGSD